MDYTEYTKFLIGLLAIVNPFGAIPIFVALTSDVKESERKRIARIIVVAVTTILLVSLMFGERVLHFFGITINSFTVGGGILILLMAISMVQARISPVSHTEEEAQESESKTSVAVVPLAIPLLAGPGDNITVIIYSHKDAGVSHYLMMGIDILILAGVLWTVLQLVPWISRHVSQTGINIFTRIMGLILMAIAIEFIANGMKGLFPVLG